MTKGKGGRKGKYKEWLKPDNLVKLEGWARDGLTDIQIASNIGISTGRLYEWKKKYNEIDEALKRGKEVIDFEVENALLKRAMGYEYEERTYEDGVLSKRVVKQQPPDVTAQIFWLKNRMPHKWRDKRNIEANVEIANPFEDISTEDIKALVGELDE